MNGTPGNPMSADVRPVSPSTGIGKKRRNKSAGNISKTCINCEKIFMVFPGRRDTAEFCSRKCHNKKSRMQSFKVEQGIPMKRCSICQEYLDLSSFSKCKRNGHGFSYCCKSCASISFKEWSLKYKDALILKRKTNRIILTAKNIEWQKKNPGKVSASKRRTHVKSYATPRGKLNLCVKVSICRTIQKGSKRNRHWEDLVGYTVEKLKKHLEKQFTPQMFWDNHGTYWHIDHKIPISAFNYATPEDADFKRCWALKNLQPLEARKNIQKSDKLQRPFQPSLTI